MWLNINGEGHTHIIFFNSTVYKMFFDNPATPFSMTPVAKTVPVFSKWVINSNFGPQSNWGVYLAGIYLPLEHFPGHNSVTTWKERFQDCIANIQIFTSYMGSFIYNKIVKERADLPNDYQDYECKYIFLMWGFQLLLKATKSSKLLMNFTILIIISI